MKEYLVIDGYNLLYAWAEQEGVVLKEDVFDVMREKLIERIANYTGATGFETVLVFDAAGRSSLFNSEEYIDGVFVVFTNKDESADTYIERFLYQRPKYTRAVLVSSDGLIQDMAVFTGAERLSSRQFLTVLKDNEKSQQKYREDRKAKPVNVFGEHLDGETKKIFEKLRKGDPE